MPQAFDVEFAPNTLAAGDPVRGALLWWSQAIGLRRTQDKSNSISVENAQERSDRLRGNVTIELGPTDCFVAHLRLPATHLGQHRNAIELAISRHAPFDLSQLTVFVESSDRLPAYCQYSIAMARKSRLRTLEVDMGKLGAGSVAFSASGLVHSFSSNVRRRKDAGWLVATLIALTALMIVSAAASEIWVQRFQRETLAILDIQKNARSAIVQAETKRVETEVAATLLSNGALQQRSGMALESLAELTSATPPTAWWSEMIWTPREVTIRASAHRSTEMLAAISEALPDRRVEMQAASQSTQGRDRVEIRITTRAEN